MDEIEQLREVGKDTPSPSLEEVATERRRLLASIEATSRSTRRHWWQRGRVVLGVAVAAIAIPGGLALAGTFESEVNVPGSVPASACPEATEAWAQAAFPEGTPEAVVRGPDEWVQECPSLERVQEMISAIRQDVELRAEMEARGVIPSNSDDGIFGSVRQVPEGSRPLFPPPLGTSEALYPECPIEVQRLIVTKLETIGEYGRLPGYPVPGCPSAETLAGATGDYAVGIFLRATRLDPDARVNLWKQLADTVGRGSAD